MASRYTVRSKDSFRKIAKAKYGDAALAHALASRLAWGNPAPLATKIRCHKVVAPTMVQVFSAVERAGLKSAVRTYGGCYNYRPKRTGSRPSTHSWGIALDLNPGTNAMGTAGDMDPRLVELFREHGFKWGGDWTGRNKDPMHFQFCTGY